MLRELSVQNLALIEDARVELESGFCAWTGETGAGKSLLLTALGLVLGEKASSDLVRSGKEEARAAAVFDLGPATRRAVEQVLGGPLDDDQLILTRRISAQGRSTAQANGLPVTIVTLRRLGERLLDVHGQNDSRALLDPDEQRRLLDAYGRLAELRETYQAARAAHESIRRRRLELIEAADRRRRERELLSFERDELTAAEPRAGEYADLLRDAHRIANSESIREAAVRGYAILYDGERSAQELLGRVARSIRPLAESVPELGEAASALERIVDEVREIAYTLRDAGDDAEGDGDSIESIESRLALYRRLATRFRCEPDQLADRHCEIEAQLSRLERDDADLASLDAPLAAARGSVVETAAALTDARRRVAKSFARAVQDHFKALGLAAARLTVQIEPLSLGTDPTEPAPPESGADRLEMMFAPNPGEPPRPLRKIASGGELSRVTLALKTVLAEVDEVHTLVFDEVDTGVGGRLGDALGKMLTALAKHHQVICITHLPQIASFAAHQWVIRKQTARGRTRTTIEPVVDEARVSELAAMLRGEGAAEGTRKEALAMLAAARQAG